jgi:hypothetical protein
MSLSIAISQNLFLKTIPTALVKKEFSRSFFAYFLVSMIQSNKCAIFRLMAKSIQVAIP